MLRLHRSSKESIRTWSSREASILLCGSNFRYRDSDAVGCRAASVTAAMRILHRGALLVMPYCRVPDNAFEVTCTPIQARVLQILTAHFRARALQHNLRDRFSSPLSGEHTPVSL
jgi:hypothetical protein